MNNAPVIAFIGFGEAAQAFVEGFGQARPGRLVGYDRKTDVAALREAKLNEFARLTVAPRDNLAKALADADIVISVVTADQSLAAARAAALSIRPGARFFDFNSVSPSTKQAARDAIVGSKARYADVAVAAPVRPALLAVPLLVCADKDADAMTGELVALGFNAKLVPGGVGRASAIKMIRSIMIKGMEALTAECLLSAYAAGVEDEILASLDGSFPGFDWTRRADYNLDRMMVHGQRRAAEMEESARTARDLGLGGGMAAATAVWQARIGALDLPLTDTLESKARNLLAALGKNAR